MCKCGVFILHQGCSARVEVMSFKTAILAEHPRFFFFFYILLRIVVLFSIFALKSYEYILPFKYKWLSNP